jgi:hypothetical protein
MKNSRLIKLISLACILPRLAFAQSATEPITLKNSPELVAAGVISGTWSEFSPSITPDGKTLFFTITDNAFSRLTLMQSNKVNGQWAAPTVLPFSGMWTDGDGSLSPDGAFFVFISNRPTSGQVAKADLDLWLVERDKNGMWGEPKRLPDSINSTQNEIYPSIARDGSLYFGRPSSATEGWFRSHRVNGEYQAPEKLPFAAASFAVAPDESFGVLGKADAKNMLRLHWIEQNDGKWSTPRLLEGAVQGNANDFANWITQDGQTLYFSSNRTEGSTAWPRAKRVTSYDEVTAEFEKVIFNRLRNIYRLDISELRSNAAEKK